MGAKVTFDSVNRLITVTEAPVNGLVTLDVQVDLYSDMKEDIRASATLAANPNAILPSLGGVTTPTGFTGRYYFINNAEGWRIQPYDADHELLLVGNLFAADTSIPWFVYRTGRTIGISREFSNLAEIVVTGVTGLNATEAAQLDFIYQNEGGRWLIDEVTQEFVVYEDDNVTEVARFSLRDADGVPTSDPALARERVRV